MTARTALSLFKKSFKSLSVSALPRNTGLDIGLHRVDGRLIPLISTPTTASLHSLPGNRFHTLTSLWPQSPTAKPSCRNAGTHLPDSSVSWSLGSAGIEELSDFTALEDEQLQTDVSNRISASINQGEHGRLFAVVFVRSLQYKVTPGDIIVVKHDFPPDVGERIRLEKVLAVGGSDFTLFGQPLLSRSQVSVEATVVEKTLSHNRVWFVYRKRKNFQRFHVYRERHTMLLINSIRVVQPSQHTDVESVDQVEGKHSQSMLT